MDNRGKGVVNEISIKIGEHFERFFQSKTKLKGVWGSFRGANFDNINTNDRSLISNFEGENGAVKWSVELGEGHAGAAIFNGLVYVLDYNEDIRADMLHCYELETGKEVWRRWYKVPIKCNHGMSRTVPAVTDRFIVTIGPRCHAMCLDRVSGDFIWGIDMEKEYQTETPLWYTGQCPLVEDGVAIFAPGGSSLMIAVDCSTGEKIWDLPNPDGWKMSHSSVTPYTFKGKKMYLYAAIGGLVAVSAEGNDVGTVLWKTTEWDPNVIAPSPLGMPDGRIFLTAGYGAGSMMLQLSESNGNYSVEVIDEYKPREGLACEQQTPILWEGHLFGICPKDGGMYRNQFVCVHPDDTKNILWASDKENRFGLEPYFWADGTFYLLNDDGTLHIIEASVNGYKHLASKNIIPDGHDAWAPIAIADGFMVLRDARHMVCIEVQK